MFGLAFAVVTLSRVNSFKDAYGLQCPSLRAFLCVPSMFESLEVQVLFTT